MTHIGSYGRLPAYFGGGEGERVGQLLGGEGSGKKKLAKGQGMLL